MISFLYYAGSPEAPPAQPLATPGTGVNPSTNPTRVVAPEPQLDDSESSFQQTIPAPISNPLTNPLEPGPMVFSPPPPSPPQPSPSPSPVPSPPPSPLPATILPSPSKPSPPPSPSPTAQNPPSVDELKAPKKKPPPPPSKSTSKKSSGDVSTTTIIIAVASGVGGLIAIVIITSIWCSCRKNKKAATNAAGKQGGGDIEAGSMHMNGHDSKYYSSDMEHHLSAADVYKSELRAQQYQQQQYQQVQQQQSARVMRTTSVKSQPVPVSLLEPSDVAKGSYGAPTMLNSTGPLAAGVSVVTGGAVIAVAATASAMTGGARSTGASPTKSKPTATASQSRSTISGTAMHAASNVTQEEQDHNDALLTWIGGQLSREKEMEMQQQQHRMAVTGSTGAAIQKVPTLASRRQQQVGQKTTGITNPSPSRARFDDVSAYAIDFDTLHMGRNIGEGSFGKVYLTVWNETPVAVKVLVDSSSALDRKLDDPMRLRRLAAPVLDKLAEEAGLMASMRHPNIIQFMGIVSMPPCVVTEFCERGSLTDVLKRGRKGEPGALEALGWRLRLSMAADAAKGMLYLHARPQPIIHRDLKSPNLLVDSHWRVKVCDFNMSRIMEESGQGSSLAGTNPRWLAPELLSGEHATTYSDVFAFGVVLWELLTFELPWFKDNPWSVAHIVGNGGRLTIPNRWDLPGLDTNQFTRLDDYLDLMQRCWAQNPYDRPGFSEIIQDLKRMESSMPERIEEYRASPAPSSGGGSFSRAHSHRGSVPVVPVVQGPPSTSVPSAPSTVAPSGGTNRALVYPEYHNEFNDGNVYDDVTASMSSTAVAASMDHTGSFPQWLSRQGWGSSRPAGK